jgi:hypothetical protein
MLSIGRLGSSGGADYYLDKVANNVDDYYLGRGEAPGRWIGATPTQLGLVGQVDAQAPRNLLARQGVYPSHSKRVPLGNHANDACGPSITIFRE